MAALVLVKEQHKLAPVGECIYCGSRERLSNEHIVPFGLGGQLILPDASCGTCSKITGEFERRVLRGFMYRARIAARFPTRRPKERPAKLQVHLLGPEKDHTIDLASTEAPVFLSLPLLEPTAFMSDASEPTGVLVDGQEIIRYGGTLEELAKETGAEGIRQVDQIDGIAFARMLAKIGYAYFVGERGLPDRTSVPVLPFILGRENDGSRWVRSADFQTHLEKQGALHVLALTDGKIQRSNVVEPVTLSRVKLFVSAGAAGYEVLVQRRTTS